MNSNEIYVSLDIGTSSVKVIIGEIVNDSNLNIIGVGNVKSEGLRKGSIIDINDTVHSIKRAIEEGRKNDWNGNSTSNCRNFWESSYALEPCHGIVGCFQSKS